MNAIGDDFISFTAMDVSFSPNGKYLLVSTDKNRIIMMTMDGSQVSGNDNVLDGVAYTFI